MPAPRPSSQPVARPATAGRARASAVCLLVVVAVLLVWVTASRAAAGQGSVVGGGGGTDPAAVWPLSPRPALVRGFDPPSCTWCAGHRGIDLAGRPDQAAMAVLPGRVTFAGVVAGQGVVVIDHGTRRTTYEPVAALVHAGAMVTGGQVIGRLEVLGSHCFPAACLHLGLVRDSDSAYLDPLTLFGDAPRPVRLLPLWQSDSAPPTPERGRAETGGIRTLLPLITLLRIL